jgi:hypothetical protein
MQYDDTRFHRYKPLDNDSLTGIDDCVYLAEEACPNQEVECLQPAIKPLRTDAAKELCCARRLLDMSGAIATSVISRS